MSGEADPTPELSWGEPVTVLWWMEDEEGHRWFYPIPTWTGALSGQRLWEHVACNPGTVKVTSLNGKEVYFDRKKDVH